MSKVYQNFSFYSIPFLDIYSDLFNFFINVAPWMELDALKFLPLVSLAISSKESIILSDLASFIAPKLNIQFDSAIRNLNRFFANKNFDFIFFYHKLITNIISSYKIKHPDKRVHIVFDHEFIEHKFSILMFTLKIGKQSIPLWFRIFDFHDKSAFSYSTFTDAISYCHNLIKSVEPQSNIIFLADRFWGNHFKLMNFIDSLGDTYYIRTKGNAFIYVFDNKDKIIVRKSISQINPFIYHSKFYKDISVSYKRYRMNLAISKSVNHKEPFYILTNGDPKRAVKDYSYRFGAIEFGFKSQKSGGFFLEESQLKDLYSFSSLYTCVCISELILTLIGIDYSKNSKCFKNYKITNGRIVNGKRRKSYSFFHIGLILLEAAINGIVKIFKRFILYDV